MADAEAGEIRRERLGAGERHAVAELNPVGSAGRVHDRRGRSSAMVCAMLRNCGRSASSSKSHSSRRRQLGCSSMVPGRLAWSVIPARSSSCTATRRDGVRASIRCTATHIVVGQLAGCGEGRERAVLHETAGDKPGKQRVPLLGTLRSPTRRCLARTDARTFADLDVRAAPPAAKGRQVVRRDAGQGFAQVAFWRAERVAFALEVQDAIALDLGVAQDIAKARRHRAEVLADDDAVVTVRSLGELVQQVVQRIVDIGSIGCG